MSAARAPNPQSTYDPSDENFTALQNAPSTRFIWEHVLLFVGDDGLLHARPYEHVVEEEKHRKFANSICVGRSIGPGLEQPGFCVTTRGNVVLEPK